MKHDHSLNAANIDFAVSPALKKEATTCMAPRPSPAQAARDPSCSQHYRRYSQYRALVCYRHRDNPPTQRRPTRQSRVFQYILSLSTRLKSVTPCFTGYTNSCVGKDEGRARLQQAVLVAPTPAPALEFLVLHSLHSNCEVVNR